MVEHRGNTNQMAMPVQVQVPTRAPSQNATGGGALVAERERLLAQMQQQNGIMEHNIQQQQQYRHEYPPMSGNTTHAQPNFRMDHHL